MKEQPPQQDEDVNKNKNVNVDLEDVDKLDDGIRIWDTCMFDTDHQDPCVLCERLLSGDPNGLDFAFDRVGDGAAAEGCEAFPKRVRLRFTTSRAGRSPGLATTGGDLHAAEVEYEYGDARAQLDDHVRGFDEQSWETAFLFIIAGTNFIVSYSKQKHTLKLDMNSVKQ
eukprot:m51a1_g9123 hypothetical protein (169) ;mRNA; f:159754-177629